MSGNFQAAYRRARDKAGEAAWALLSDQEREAAVAAELQLMEEERRRRQDGDSSQDPAG